MYSIARGDISSCEGISLHNANLHSGFYKLWDRGSHRPACVVRYLPSVSVMITYSTLRSHTYGRKRVRGDFYLPHPWSRCGTGIAVKRLVPYSIEFIDTIHRRDFTSRYIHLSRNATSPLYAILINIFRPLVPISRLTIISRLTATRTDINRDLNAVIPL